MPEILPKVSQTILAHNANERCWQENPFKRLLQSGEKIQASSMDTHLRAEVIRAIHNEDMVRHTQIGCTEVAGDIEVAPRTDERNPRMLREERNL